MATKQRAQAAQRSTLADCTFRPLRSAISRSPALIGSLCDVVEQLLEPRGIDGLHEVSVEAGVARSTAIGLLPIARDGHERNSLEPRHFAQSARELVAV